MSQKKNLSILSNIDLKSLSAYYFPETADLYSECPSSAQDFYFNAFFLNLTCKIYSLCTSNSSIKPNALSTFYVL